MKNLCKIAVLSLCILLLPLSAGYGQEEPGGFTPLDGLVYYLYVKGPKSIWTPTFEFKAGNTLKVIGASSDYGQLDGIWQEARLGFFSFFWAQVESDEPVNTTTTIPDDPSDLLPQSIQPQQTEQTNFLINLWGLSFPDNPFVPIRMIIGSGDYLKASGAVYVGLAAGVVDAAFGSIAPEFGLQEETLTGVQISCFNTTFLDGFSINIVFSPGPPEKFIVSNVRALSNTLLEFNLEIATDAPLGSQSVIVSYGDPTTSVTGNSVFEVR